MRTSAMSPRLSIFWRSGLSAAVYLGLSVPALLIGVFGLSGLVPMSRALEAVAGGLALAPRPAATPPLATA